jgi:predicted nucleic acid-binding protein
VKVFVDSNVPMYVAGRDHPNRAPAKRFLEKVRRGDVEAHTSTEVLQEILYRYSSLKRLDLAAQVYDLFVQICPVVFPVTLADADRAKALVCGKAAVAPRDALHAAVMLNNGVPLVATFDSDFECIPGIKRYDMA